MSGETNQSGGALGTLSDDLASAVERAGGAIVTVQARHRIPSSGIHWRQGIIVTADHTVERDEEITVTLPDGKTVPATLAGRDPGTDLAVLRVQGVELPVAEVGDGGSLKVGHVVLAVARPGEGGVQASLGVVSLVGEGWRTHRGGQIDAMVRLDLTLYPGFSGGALVDARGKIVGLNTSGLSRGNLGLTVPATTVNRVVEALVTKGHIARGYLGIGMQPVTVPDSLKSKLGLSGSNGLIVVTVQPGGPAEAAGLFIGDILVALDGTQLTDTDDVQALLDPEKIGQALTAQIIRGGELATASVTVGERPQREA